MKRMSLYKLYRVGFKHNCDGNHRVIRPAHEYIFTQHTYIIHVQAKTAEEIPILSDAAVTEGKTG